MTAEHNTNTNDSSKHDNGVIGTIIELGAATTKLTIDQVQNAFTALTNPSAAIDHVKDTMHALSEAMNNSSSGASNRSSSDQTENDLRGAPTGREHVGTAADMNSSSYSQSSSSPYSQDTSKSYGSSWTTTGKASPRTINRRKS